MGYLQTLETCANTYLRRVDEANTAHTQRLAELEPLKGSRRYSEEAEEAKRRHDAAIETAKHSFRESSSLCIDRMREHLAGRTLEPPTEEQMRLLEALRHREKITDEELCAAARSLRGSAVALEELSEIGKRTGSRCRDFATEYSDQIPTATASAIIGNLSQTVSDLLESTARPGVYRSAMHHFEHHGGDAPEPRLMPQVEPFVDVRDFVARAGLAWSGAETAGEDVISRFEKLFSG